VLKDRPVTSVTDEPATGRPLPQPGRRAVVRGTLLSGALGVAGAVAARPDTAASAAVRPSARAAAGPRPVAAQRRAAGRPVDSDVLVVITLRGGFDGLAAVVPADDPELLRNRPVIGVPTDLLIGLDSRFGLHPALQPLHRWWQQGSLAVVHAVGQPRNSRSHLLASATLDRGGADLDDGWLHRAFPGSAPWSTVHLTGTSVPGALAGAPAVGLRTAEGFDLGALTGTARGRWLDALTRLGAGGGALKPPVAQTVAAMRAWPHPEPARGRGYPATDLGRALGEAANLVRADLGVRAICLESGGWDLHTDAGVGSQADDRSTRGAQAEQLAGLALALDAFATDLGDDLDRVTLVTVSEFGRRVDENSSAGTDHGSAGAMLLLGGGVNGGSRVAGDWPGLAAARLDHGGLPVTTDHRQVLAEVLQRRCGLRTTQVFPGLPARTLDVVHPR
jgi:uncharacterized protein (DUF1501 family)